jgi:hypothetical protein
LSNSQHSTPPPHPNKTTSKRKLPGIQTLLQKFKQSGWRPLSIYRIKTRCIVFRTKKLVNCFLKTIRTNNYVTTIIQKMVGGTSAGDFTDHPEHLHFSKSG